jgi:hypothetical protein
MHISKASPDSEMRHIWLGAIPELIRSGIWRKVGIGTHVANMDIGSNSKTLEGGRKVGLMKHGSGMLIHSPVSPLSHSILLRPVPSRVPPHNAMSS